MTSISRVASAPCPYPTAHPTKGTSKHPSTEPPVYRCTGVTVYRSTKRPNHQPRADARAGEHGSR